MSQPMEGPNPMWRVAEILAIVACYGLAVGLAVVTIVVTIVLAVSYFRASILDFALSYFMEGRDPLLFVKFMVILVVIISIYCYAVGIAVGYFIGKQEVQNNDEASEENPSE